MISYQQKTELVREKLQQLLKRKVKVSSSSLIKIWILTRGDLSVLEHYAALGSVGKILTALRGNKTVTPKSNKKELACYLAARRGLTEKEALAILNTFTLKSSKG